MLSVSLVCYNFNENIKVISLWKNVIFTFNEVINEDIYKQWTPKTRTPNSSSEEEEEYEERHQNNNRSKFMNSLYNEEEIKDEDYDDFFPFSSIHTNTTLPEDLKVKKLIINFASGNPQIFKEFKFLLSHIPEFFLSSHWCPTESTILRIFPY